MILKQIEFPQSNLSINFINNLAVCLGRLENDPNSYIVDYHLLHSSSESPENDIKSLITFMALYGIEVLDTDHNILGLLLVNYRKSLEELESYKDSSDSLTKEIFNSVEDLKRIAHDSGHQIKFNHMQTEHNEDENCIESGFVAVIY